MSPVGWLLDSSQFLSRSHCGTGWTDTLRCLYIASNASIAFSYFAIPVFLGFLYRSKRQDLPAAWMLVLFAGFILLCGLTHVCDVLVFWWAPYRLFTALYAATGVVSLAAALTLPRVVKALVKLPSREYCHALNDSLQITVSQKNVVLLKAVEHERKTSELNGRLRSEMDSLKAKLDGKLWYADRMAILDGMERLNSLIVGYDESRGVEPVAGGSINNG